jgi:hypothetical protein
MAAEFPRVHYFVWYDEGAIAPDDALWPDGPASPPADDPITDLPVAEYRNVAGGYLGDPDDPGLLINAGADNLSTGDQAVRLWSPEGGGLLASRISGDGSAVFETCFPWDAEHPEGWYHGTHFINGDLTTMQMNINGRAKTGGPKWYTLIVDVNSAVVTVGDASVEIASLLDVPEGTTATLALGAWELKTGTGPTNKGCHAFGNFGGDVEVKVRRFTANEEVLQRADTPDDPPADTGSISGIVYDSTGTPVKKATVELLMDGNVVDSATTNPKGTYTFESVPVGDYTVTASANGDSASTEVTVAGGIAVTAPDIVLQ